ncbi:hypothetical protein ACQ4PT_022775 [Festuca glaucescens]
MYRPSPSFAEAREDRLRRGYGVVDSVRADTDVQGKKRTAERRFRHDLPVVDLASPDLQSVAEAVRKACVDSGFFYVTNHGIQDELLAAVFAESKKFFELPLEEKMLLQRNSGHRGYTAPYDEKLDASSKFQGDLKESFYIGTVRDVDMQNDPNQWPPEAHSDYGMITLLATDGTPGLQICREKDKEDWKDVHHIEGSTLHRVVSVGKE